MELRHIPICFVVGAGICLAGAVTASEARSRQPAGAEQTEAGKCAQAEIIGDRPQDHRCR